MTVHRLELVDRNLDGIRHRHRWRAECSCGTWVGKNRRRQAEAVAQHTQHVDAKDGEEQGRRRHSLDGYGPRPTTPAAKLPEELR